MAEKKAYDGPPTKEIVRLAKYTPTPGVEGKSAKLATCIRDGYPRLTVFTNHPDDKVAAGAINAAVDPATFMMFLQQLEKAALANEEYRFHIECDTTRMAADKREKFHATTIVGGQDKEGTVWVSVVAQDRPKIRFDFKMNDFHRIMVNGVPMTAPEASKGSALSYVLTCRQIFPALFMDVAPPVPRDSKFGNKPRPAASGAGLDEDFNF